MKVRWTAGSVRFRITPSELDALVAGRPVSVELQVPGSAWRAEIVPGAETTGIAVVDGSLTLSLSTDDMGRLSNQNTEGIYFSTNVEPRLRYFVEKDFPCIHQKPDAAREPQDETFAPPVDFAQRRKAPLTES